ncbi:hypothetical protein M0R45_001132 [Rubus argutus]|uniref:Uncharacterized protein n=1 Tax=Rubus argutus TaxID=59490 RepID=A0AAW1VPF8_RUBAR
MIHEPDARHASSQKAYLASSRRPANLSAVKIDLAICSLQAIHAVSFDRLCSLGETEEDENEFVLVKGGDRGSEGKVLAREEELLAQPLHPQVTTLPKSSAPSVTDAAGRMLILISEVVNV